MWLIWGIELLVFLNMHSTIQKLKNARTHVIFFTRTGTLTDTLPSPFLCYAIHRCSYTIFFWYTDLHTGHTGCSSTENSSNASRHAAWNTCVQESRTVGREGRGLLSFCWYNPWCVRGVMQIGQSVVHLSTAWRTTTQRLYSLMLLDCLDRSVTITCFFF